MKQSQNSKFTAYYHAILSGEKKPYWNSKDMKNTPLIKFVIDKRFGSHIGIDAHTLTRGQNKDKIILKMVCFDYTKEHLARKVTWKLKGRGIYNSLISKIRTLSGKTDHISKIYPLSENRAWIDFGNLSNDAAYLIFDKDMTYEGVNSIKIFIALDTKNDESFKALFVDGFFDKELAILEAKAQNV